MKRALYILICLLTGIAVLSALVGMGCSPSASDPTSPVVLCSHYTITASAGVGGSISPVGPVVVSPGQSQTFSITPNAGYAISNVRVDGTWVGAVSSYTFTNVTRDHTIRATFSVIQYTITASAGVGGSISPVGAVSVSHGQSQTFSITSNTGYAISDVLVNGTSVGAVSSYTFTNVTKDHTIQAVFSVIQYTITASAGVGGSISPVGAVGVSHGQSQGFSITPNAGYAISEVRVDGTSVGAVASYTFTNVTDDHMIHADFNVMQYTITASAGVGGSISPTGTVGVSHGQSLTFDITPNTGYVVSDVLVDGTSVGAVSSYTFTDVTDNHTIHVDFSVIQYTITASAGVGGSISPMGAVGVSHGQSQTFDITPNAGYAISDVLVDGTSVGAVSSYTFEDVTSDHTIHAAFSVIQYTITASAGDGGSISPVGTVGVSHGQSQDFSITPNAGYAISGVLVDGTPVGVVSSYTFTDVTGNHWIHAAFNVIQYIIAASAGDGGSISPVGAVVVSHGQSQTFDITPNTGYEISEVLVDGTPMGTSSYTFTEVTDDHTIHAVFNMIQYIITASSGDGGSISPVDVVGVSHGQSQTFDITPNAGYVISDILVDGKSVGVVSSYTFEGVASDHTIYANFKLIPPYESNAGYGLTLAVSPGVGGTATDETGAASYEEGDIVAIRALATTCYDFVSWTAPAGVLADSYAAETSFTMPGQPVTVTANFEFIGNPTRALPDQVLPGEKFTVTVTFIAPSDGFHAIALTDVAPAGWDVSVNVIWSEPEATAVYTPAAETAAYVWYGPYDVCATFAAVYEVRVPVNAEPGTYTFSGSLKYYIETHPTEPYEQEVTGDIQVRVKKGETVKIEGVTKEVDGAILPGAAIVLYQNGEAIANVVSDETGNYEFEFSELGDYEVMVSKAGFRGEAQSISVTTLAIYTLDFAGDHGLIPDAPDISYVLACISLWKFGEPPLQLSTFRVLDVTSAWIYPIT